MKPKIYSDEWVQMIISKIRWRPIKESAASKAVKEKGAYSDNRYAG